MLFLTSSQTNIVFLFHVQNKPRKKQKTQHIWKTIEQKPFHSQKDFTHNLGQLFSFFFFFPNEFTCSYFNLLQKAAP